MSENGYAVDTGPLLCFGAIPDGPRIAWSHLNPMVAPPAVLEELNRTSGRPDSLGQAAQVWLGTRGSALKAVTLSSSQEAMADAFQTMLHEEANSGYVRMDDDDRGEAECIAVAVEDDSGFATNDRVAASLATDESVEVVTTAEMLRHDLESGNRSLADTRKAVTRMQAAGLDIGENISGTLDLRRSRGS